MTSKALGLMNLIVGLAGVAALGAFVMMLGTGWWQHLIQWGNPWLVNAGLLGIFSLQHSGMARSAFKQGWTRWLPERWERSVYVGLSGLVTLLLVFLWQPIPGPDWWRGPWALGALALAAVVGLWFVGLGQDPLTFLGFRQAWGESTTKNELRITGPYRLVRHPLMSCLLIFLWAQPIMSPTLGMLAGGLTLYVLVGTWLEEKELVRQFGQAYLDYRKKVPALLPWRGLTRS
jgi:protein-S-isoprenylcysteine O-methyltransferase Ste14